MSEHKARQYSDEMVCTLCGKTWDVNDPDPPKCVDTKKRPEGRKDWRRRRSYKPFK